MASSTIHRTGILDKSNGVLSQHIDAWGEAERKGGEEGWSQLSYDSSEMEKFSSPFGDIGFLAGDPVASSVDPAVSAPRSLHPKKQEVKPKQDMNQKPDKNKLNAKQRPTRGATLGTFLEKAQDADEARVSPPRDCKSTQSRLSAGRLEKSISTRNMFKDEDASLGLSVALGRKDRSSEPLHQLPDEQGTNPTRNAFDFSMASFGISVLGASKTKSSRQEGEDTKERSSRTFFFSTTDGSSRNSFGVFGSSSKTNAGEKSSKLSKGSKFSIMMRKDKNEKKVERSEEIILNLETQKDELRKENNMLHAKLDELKEAVAKDQAMREWMSFQQLADVTTEMWQYQTLALLADVHMDKLEARLVAFQKLVDAKERSITNLEKIRNKQEQRIGYLEIQCLQNGVDISEDEGVISSDEYLPRKLPREPRKTAHYSDDDESLATFRDDELPFNVGYSPARLDTMARSSRSSSGGSNADRIEPSPNNIEKSERSESNYSAGMSDLSDESEMEDEPAPVKPDSWAELKLPIGSAHKSPSSSEVLGSYLVATADKSKPCLETGTWDPTKELDFDHETSSSPRGVGGPPPPLPGPSQHTSKSAPAPSTRTKLIQSRSMRSKSPGTRRRLKGTKPECIDVSGHSKPRSKSPGTRRKVKADNGSNALSLATLKRCQSSNSVTSRRKLKPRGKSSSRKLKPEDPLASSSTHSLGNRRRLRKEQEFDRQTVSTALEKALGASVNTLEDMDDNLLQYLNPLKKPPQRSYSDGANCFMHVGEALSSDQQRGAIKKGAVPSMADEAEDVGLDLLDAVFQD